MLHTIPIHINMSGTKRTFAHILQQLSHNTAGEHDESSRKRLKVTQHQSQDSSEAAPELSDPSQVITGSGKAPCQAEFDILFPVLALNIACNKWAPESNTGRKFYEQEVS